MEIAENYLFPLLEIISSAILFGASAYLENSMV
jgi:hypothetical protein